MYRTNISNIFQSYLIHNSDIEKAYLKQISDISKAHLRYILNIYQANLRYISDAYLGHIQLYLKHIQLENSQSKAWKFLRHSSEISNTYLIHISYIYQTYLQHISGKSQNFLSHISGISHLHIRYILFIYQKYLQYSCSDISQLQYRRRISGKPQASQKYLLQILNIFKHISYISQDIFQSNIKPILHIWLYASMYDPRTCFYWTFSLETLMKTLVKYFRNIDETLLKHW